MKMENTAVFFKLPGCTIWNGIIVRKWCLLPAEWKRTPSATGTPWEKPRDSIPSLISSACQKRDLAGVRKGEEETEKPYLFSPLSCKNSTYNSHFCASRGNYLFSQKNGRII